MNLPSLEVVLASGFALAAGAAAGWLARGLRQARERSVQEALWMRKLRLADEDQNRALRAIGTRAAESRALQGELESTAQALAEERHARERESREGEALRAELERLHGERRALLEERESDRRGREAEGERTAAAYAGLQADVERTRASLAAARARVAELESEAERRAAELAEVARGRAGLEERLRRLSGEHKALQLRVARQRAPAPHDGPARERRRPPAAGPKRSGSPDAAESDAAESEAPGPPGAGSGAPAAPARAARRRRELTRVRGIGPALARQLERAGIRTLSELAAVDESALDELARAVGVKADRIRREGWVQAAARALESG